MSTQEVVNAAYDLGGRESRIRFNSSGHPECVLQMAGTNVSKCLQRDRLISNRGTNSVTD